MIHVIYFTIIIGLCWWLIATERARADAVRIAKEAITCAKDVIERVEKGV